MSLRLYNTLSHRLEEFEPLEPGKVRMYNCGPTVYSYPHIGNYRTFLFADLLRRYLEYRGYQVTQIMNITDVGHLTRDDVEAGEDKVDRVARELGWDPYRVTEHFASAFFEDRRLLGFLEPHQFPRATAHVPEMIAMIEQLLKSGFAYLVSGNIYFDVTKFSEYGKLSGNTLDQVKAGARVEVNPEKRHPADFALWKTDPKHLMQFDSPWGRGFPGWHIECSAMSRKYLGDTLDIHTGGEDNIFPHHECEIAQSEAFSGKTFVRYWVHPRFMLFDSEKISKSKGTPLTVKFFLEKGYEPMVLRYALASSHYRQQVSFTLQLLDDAGKALGRLREFRRRLAELEGANRGEPGNDALDAILQKSKEAFVQAMDDDMNVSGALSVMHDFVRDVNRTVDQGGLGSRGARKALEVFEGFDSVFGVLGKIEGAETVPAEMQSLLQDREAARKKKDFAGADAIRKKIEAGGWVVVDTKDGSKLQRK